MQSGTECFVGTPAICYGLLTIPAHNGAHKLFESVIGSCISDNHHKHDAPQASCPSYRQPVWSIRPHGAASNDCKIQSAESWLPDHIAALPDAAGEPDDGLEFEWGPIGIIYSSQGGEATVALQLDEERVQRMADRAAQVGV